MESNNVTFENTINAITDNAIKIGHCVHISFEFYMKAGYNFNGNAKIATLPYKARSPQYGGVAWISNNNTAASIYVNEDKLYMQSSITIPENVTIRGGIDYLS